MSSETPTPRQLRLLGAIVLIAIAGLGLFVAKVPGLLGPDVVEWVVTVPVKNGADGLEAGGNVLVGGMLRGKIRNVREIQGSAPTPTSNQELIRIEFELDKTIVLARDAIISRGVTTAGNIGFLNIRFPGSVKRRFKSGEQRVIPIWEGPSPGGPSAGVLGLVNGQIIGRISAQAEKLAKKISTRDESIASELFEISAMIQRLRLDVDADVPRVLALVARLGERIRLVLEKLPLLQKAASRVRSEATLASEDLERALEEWRRRFELIEVGTAEIQEDVNAMQAFVRNLESRLTATALDLRNAMEDAESVSIRLRGISPEISDGLSRTLARMVLAGGQLKLAIKDLLPLAIEAITTRPDRASLSRRLLLESTNDVVLAGMDLRDAARRLDWLSRSPESSQGDDVDPRPSLGEALQRLERTLERLGGRLRDEIEGELR